MQLISSFLSDDTVVSLVSEAAAEEPESFNFHVLVNGKIECSYTTWAHAWEDFGRCVRCTTLEDAVSVARS
jgi:hypothetical protein